MADFANGRRGLAKVVRTEHVRAGGESILGRVSFPPGVWYEPVRYEPDLELELARVMQTKARNVRARGSH